MHAGYRKKLLAQKSPKTAWPGEPLLGGSYGEEEIEAAVKAIEDSMDPVVGFGSACAEIEQFEAAFARYCGTRYAVSINGAGTGLDMAMMALDLQPGDEIICPSINFLAQPMSIIGQGGTWVPCEVDPKTLTADPDDVKKRITPKTRAIYPVHMNGLSAPMDDYIELAQNHPHAKHGPLKVIGDAARACGGSYRGQKIGKKGWMTVFSFHTQKLMTTLGEGGAITTDDADLVERLKGIRQFGQGDCWGSNYKLTKVQAAVGLVQLRKLDSMIARRRTVAARRNALLAGIPELSLPCGPPDCEHTYYLYTLLVPRNWAGQKRNRLLTLLRDAYSVNTVVANPAAHTTVPFLAKRTVGVHLPVSEELGQRLFCLPIHPDMSDGDNGYICAALWDAVESIGR